MTETCTPDTPADRANRVEQIFALTPYDEVDSRTSSVDVLADLYHLADREGWDMDQIIESAQMHHKAEVEEWADTQS